MCLAWTDSPPSESGLYLTRNNSVNAVPRIAEVISKELRPEGRWVKLGEGWENVEAFQDRWWYGPIQQAPPV